MNILVIYLVTLNAIGFILMLADKQAAKNKRRRISERNLLMTGWIGGSLGVFLGMQVAHHKTLHKKFSIGIPIALILHLILLAYLIRHVPLPNIDLNIFPGLK